MAPAQRVRPMEEHVSDAGSSEELLVRAAPRLTLIVGRSGTGKTSALDAIWDNVTGVAGWAQGLHDGAAVYARDD